VLYGLCFGQGALTKLGTLTKLSAIDVETDDRLPTEFRIFRRGQNPSQRGVALFDDKAAAEVMRRYREWGVDLIIDLQHDSIDPEVRKHRADAADARGHFKLEVRNGELWAVDVRWSEDGARRLRSKTQRYTSPAFYDDAEGRVMQLVNVGLVSMPATNGNAPLVAASYQYQGDAATRAACYVRARQDVKKRAAAFVAARHRKVG
jgi:phage I-like protein